MYLKMKETQLGSRDGRFTERFEADKTYAVEADLAEVFLSEGWAEQVDAPEVDVDVDETPLEDLNDLELAAKVLELDPEANPTDVEQAIVSNRPAVISAAHALQAQLAGDDVATPEADGLDGLSRVELKKIADSEGIKLPAKASNDTTVAIIRAARADKAQS